MDGSFMKVYIFYNGNDYYAPDNGDWGNFRYINNPRLFLACANSWQQAGFEPHRITTETIDGFSLTGYLFGSVIRGYSHSYWNIWYKLREQLDDKRYAFVVNMNVFAHGIRPYQIVNNALSMLSQNKEAVALHDNGWSASCMIVTKAFCERAIETINKVDSGELPLPPDVDLMIDDKIIAHYLPMHFLRFPICGFPFIRTDWRKFQMLHFARSITTRSMDSIPVV